MPHLLDHRDPEVEEHSALIPRATGQRLLDGLGVVALPGHTHVKREPDDVEVLRGQPVIFVESLAV